MSNWYWSYINRNLPLLESQHIVILTLKGEVWREPQQPFTTHTLVTISETLQGDFPPILPPPPWQVSRLICTTYLTTEPHRPRTPQHLVVIQTPWILCAHWAQEYIYPETTTTAAAAAAAAAEAETTTLRSGPTSSRSESHTESLAVWTGASPVCVLASPLYRLSVWRPDARLFVSSVVIAVVSENGGLLSEVCPGFSFSETKGRECVRPGRFFF